MALDETLHGLRVRPLSQRSVSLTRKGSGNLASPGRNLVILTDHMDSLVQLLIVSCNITRSNITIRRKYIHNNSVFAGEDGA